MTAPAGAGRQDGDMRIGISIRTAQPTADVRTGARHVVERARAAWEAGLDSLFIGDHHATAGNYYQNSPMLGRVLAEWGDRPAGALYLLPLWHPVLVAEQVGTLASLAGGRFVLQCAIGAGEEQFRALDADLRTRGRVFEERLTTIRRLLAGEEVDGVRVNPVTPEPLEVWIGGHAAPAIDRAARMGDAWLAGPEVDAGRAGDLAEQYRQACARHDRRPGVVAVRRDIHVGSDDTDARRVADPVIAAGYRGMAPDVPVVGGPGRVAEQFLALADLGYTDVIVRHLADDQADVLASIERLAEVRALVGAGTT